MSASAKKSGCSCGAQISPFQGKCEAKISAAPGGTSELRKGPPGPLVPSHSKEPLTSKLPDVSCLFKSLIRNLSPVGSYKSLVFS